MKRGFIGLAMSAMIALGAALSLPSCGHDQKLESIAVTPTQATFPSPDPKVSLPADFTATGTYIHPPETKDITAQVTWKIDVSGLVTFTYDPSVGEVVAPTGTSCGIASVWATAPEGTGGSANIVISPPSTVTVEDTSVSTCPGGAGATAGTLVVTPAGTGTGLITSSIGSISCPGLVCGAEILPSNNQVTLTESPGANSTFSYWSPNCPSPPNTPSQCVVTVPSGELVNVLAYFAAE